jgi:hypothetical protein
LGIIPGRFAPYLGNWRIARVSLDEANKLKEPWRRLDGGAWMAALGFDF